jgi:undecaprenyl pyrophosphate phosphatase UppP
MVRTILAVIVAYIAMSLVVMVCFTSLQFGLGTEKVFRPASYESSTLFNMVGLLVTVVAGVVGGLVAAAIAKNPRGPLSLAILIIAVGLLMAFLNLSKPDPGPRAGDISPMEAAMKARQPDWYSFSIPFLGAAGVMIGGRLKKRR